MPFMTVNDSILNRKFTEQFTVSIILGIEEYLDGPLLSLINERGFVAFGYEGGAHNNIRSLENHVAFIYLSMNQAGTFGREGFDVSNYHDQLAYRTTTVRGIMRYTIDMKYQKVSSLK